MRDMKRKAFPELRLPVSIIQDLKVLANQRGVPYPSLLEVFRLTRERQGRSG